MGKEIESYVTFNVLTRLLQQPSFFSINNLYFLKWCSLQTVVDSFNFLTDYSFQYWICETLKTYPEFNICNYNIPIKT